MTDSKLLSHYGGNWMRGYWYGDGSDTVEVAPGPVSIHAGRGFEWRPATLEPVVTSDTTITIALEACSDLRALGWHSGDTHAHTRHEPIEYDLDPADVLRVAEAEDLAMLWLLDQHWNFTGGPRLEAAPRTVLYYTTEWRNQAYGHVALLGLTEMMGTSCCASPAPAYPTLSMLREAWNPGPGQAMVLAHPRTTEDFFQDDGWPGWGLGRELPVLAASGNLDALDLASYSNLGSVCLDDWMSLLSSGHPVGPSAGTDALMNRFSSGPPGAWRVYVREEGEHTAGGWVEGLKAGRSFVTNYPLIPGFTVGGAATGDRLSLPGPAQELPVRIRVESALRPSTVTLLRNGAVERQWTVTGPSGQWRWDYAANVTVSESSWFAVSVRGTTTSRHAVDSGLFAITGAVHVDLDACAPRSTAAAGRMCDRIDSVEAFVLARGHWPGEEQRAEVLQRLAAAREEFARAFVAPPGPFASIAPAEGDTLYAGSAVTFDWTDTVDPEAGDRIAYYLSFTEDTSLVIGDELGPYEESAATFASLPLRAGLPWWWRVEAVDRGGNRTVGSPAWRSFLLAEGVPAAGPEWFPAGSPGRGFQVRVTPNPTTGAVRFELVGSPDPGLMAGLHGGLFEVIDVAGRRVASVPVVAGGGAVWSGREAAGAPAPSGSYWIRFLAAGHRPRGIDRCGKVVVIR